MNDNVIVELKNINKYTTKNTIGIKDISFTIRKGEVVALIGEPSSGKSTISKILSGYLKPDSGTIYIKNKPFDELYPNQSISKGLVTGSSEYSLCMNMSTLENLFLISHKQRAKLGIINYSTIRNEATQILQKLGMECNLDLPLYELDIQEIPIIEIAKSLLTPAILYIFDEVTTGMEEYNLNNLYEVINKLKNKGISFLYIPSKLAEVFEIADRVIILRNGKIATALSIDETNLEELPELTFSSEKALLSVVNTKFSQLEDTSEDMEDFINYSISLFNKLLHIDKLCIIWNESGNVRLGTSKTIDDFYPGLKENLYNIKETILKLTNELNHNEVEKAITQKISHIEEKFKYIPITYGKEVLGTALVFGKSFDRYLDNKILFHNLFNYLSISFNNYIEKEHEKREERELQIAGQIQHNLTTPNFNSFTKLDVYGYSKAAKIVGGDYFDLFKINDYKYVGIMVDVSGKGIPAALIMVMIRSIIKNTINVNITANELMSVLNNALVGEIPEDRYATTYLFIIDTKKHIIDFCNGGHHSMILIRNDKDKTEIYSLDSDGIPVGIVSNYDYQNKKTIIKDKDMFILYTDGITEAMNKDREEFGKNRLIKIISKYQYLKSRDISMLINKAITKFTEGKQHDDETILIFKLV